jgi:hypothetical protein
MNKLGIGVALVLLLCVMATGVAAQELRPGNEAIPGAEVYRSTVKSEGGIRWACL